jgi:hypothetical protein
MRQGGGAVGKGSGSLKKAVYGFSNLSRCARACS